jgi:hypothetical protein
MHAGLDDRICGHAGDIHFLAEGAPVAVRQQDDYVYIAMRLVIAARPAAEKKQSS